MSALKKVDKKTALSVNDLRLKRYLELEQTIKLAKKEFDTIKDEIKHSGGMSTRNYVAIVVENDRTTSPPLKKLVEIYGEGVRKHCTTSTTRTVKVSKKVGT